MTHKPAQSVIALCLACAAIAGACAAELQLVNDGVTSYRVVQLDEPSAVDVYAAETLKKYLKQVSGAEFATADSAGLAAGQPAIFVGFGNTARKRLGVVEPLAGLEAQEHVCRSKGADIFLYGQGVHGQLWAVVEFYYLHGMNMG